MECELGAFGMLVGLRSVFFHLSCEALLFNRPVFFLPAARCIGRAWCLYFVKICVPFCWRVFYVQSSFVFD